MSFMAIERIAEAAEKGRDMEFNQEIIAVTMDSICKVGFGVDVDSKNDEKLMHIGRDYSFLKQFVPAIAY
jgi:hypothetical protein